MEVIEWVADRCQDWSAQYRKREFPIGWPPISDMTTFAYQHNPKGLTEAAQEVSQAVFRMRATRDMELPYRVLIAHSLFAGGVKAKLQLLDMDKFTYWRTGLHAAHCFLSARIEQPMRQTA